MFVFVEARLFCAEAADARFYGAAAGLTIFQIVIGLYMI